MLSRRSLWLATLGLVAAAALADRAAASPTVPPGAPAVDPREVLPAGQVRFRSFGAPDGLRNLVVWSLAQDGAGMVWVGTDDGVYRYDGKRFAHFSVEDGLRSSAVAVLGAAPDGPICAGGGNGLVCWNPVTQRFDGAATTGLPPIPVLAIARRGAQLWVGTRDGLYVRRGGAPFVRAPDWPGGDAPVHALWADDRGVVAAFGAAVVRGDGEGAWQVGCDGLGAESIDGVVRDRAGTIWIRTPLKVWAWSPEDRALRDLSAGIPPSHEVTGHAAPLTVSPTGEVWIGTDHGVAFRRDERWHVVDRDTGLPGALGRSLLIDREGTTWVGAIGLYQWAGRGLIDRHDAPSGLPGEIAMSIGRDARGRLWIGTDRCLVRAVDGAWQCQPDTAGRIYRTAVWLPDGSGFLGGAPGDLLYLDPSGAARSLRPEPFEPQDHILTLALEPHGDLWIGTRSALLRLPGARPGRIEPAEIPGIALPTRISHMLHADGRLWVATEGGLAVREAGRWRVFDVRDGLRATATRYLLRRADGRMCVSYNEAIGLSCFRYDGQRLSAFEHLGEADGLAAGMVYFLGEDRAHRLWIGTGNGVDVVTPRDGRDAGREIDHFGEADGLVGNDCVGTAFFLDGDGSLWLGASGGVSHLQAQHYAGPPAPPGAIILAARLGGQAIRAGAQPAQAPHDASSLLVEFAAGSFLDPARLEYQTRLEPLEAEWSTNPTREIRTPALPPGSYRLAVRARRDAAAWGPTTELGFDVLAAWWQTRWIVALLLGAALVAVAAAVAWRYRAMVRRRTRQLIDQADASFHAHIDSLPDLVAVYRGSALVHLNAAATAFLGAGVDPRARIHDDDRAALARAIATPPGGPARHAEIVELRLCASDGSWRVCEVSSLRLRYGGGPVMVVSGRDVTERQRMRAQLLISDRMASVGTLAAGIAHEINNPLAYVAGNLEVVIAMLAGTAPLSDDDRKEASAALDDALDGADRVKKIVQELRSFNRAEQEHRVPLELAGVIHRAIKLTQNEIRHRAQLIVELGATPRVLADDGRLTQVLINLLANAAQAVPPGHSEQHRIVVRTHADADGHAVVEVEDTGPGMPPHVRARAFDPFFTTKDVGQGTGLGLSICHGIISALGGQISLDTGALGGCLVRVSLPLDRSGAAVEPRTEPPVAPAPSPRRRVLLIDDDPMVTTALERMLRNHYDVAIAGSGEHAVRLITDTDGAWFDAVVSDVMMPTMTGLDVLDRIAAHSPAQARRFVFLSGGVFSDELRDRLDAAGAPQLDKPIDAAALRAALIEITEAPANEVTSQPETDVAALRARRSTG